MAGYRVTIYVEDTGFPVWLHDWQQEKELNAEQQETLNVLHAAYKLRQCELDMERHLQQESDPLLKAQKAQKAGSK